jgi:Cu(I)/Ag(I) efflux system membrane fusion protein
MAFDNKGAYWLSDQAKIRNPYFGDKMLECGEVKDTLNYSKN